MMETYICATGKRDCGRSDNRNNARLLVCGGLFFGDHLGQCE